MTLQQLLSFVELSDEPKSGKMVHVYKGFQQTEFQNDFNFDKY